MSHTEAEPDERVPEERFEFNEEPEHDRARWILKDRIVNMAQPLLCT